MEVAEGKRAARTESVWLRVDGIKKGKGVLLLYPDQLACVKVRAELWFWVLMILVLGIAAGRFAPDCAVLAPILGGIVGGWIGRPVDRKLAVRAMARGSGRATIIPLEEIVSLRTGRSAGLGDWFVTETLVVTTADVTQYTFTGRTSYVLADIAGAIASHGRDVRATPFGLTVTPRAAVAEG
jgi:hypothetical protein